ncbi:MAG: DUF2232 domain-containing protein [Syntrophomonadaceae bacterium]
MITGSIERGDAMGSFIIYLLLTVLASLAMLATPTVAMITALIWGTLLIIASLHLDAVKLIALFIANLIVVAYVGGIPSLIYILAFYGIPAVVMGLLTSKQRGYYEARRWGATALITGVSIYLGVLYQSGGGSYFAEQVNQMVMQASAYYESQGWTQLYQQAGITQEEFNRTLQRIGANLLHHLPAIFYVQGLMAVFIMLWLASFFAFNQASERLKKKPFAHEMMPWELAWLVNIGLALWLIAWDERNLTHYIGSNILVVMAVISFYYGLASLVFRIKYESRRGRIWVILLLAVLALFFPLSALGFLCILGIFDSLLDLRKPFTRQEG